MSRVVAFLQDLEPNSGLCKGSRVQAYWVTMPFITIFIISILFIAIAVAIISMITPPINSTMTLFLLKLSSVVHKNLGHFHD